MENIEEIKNDKQFLKNLKDQEKRALLEGNIIELYEVLDMILMLDLDEDRLENIYFNILKIAFEDLKEKLELETKYKITNNRDALITRAIYERGIESWSNEDLATANDIFLILFHTTNDEILKKSFSIHFLATQKQINIDNFYELFVNRDDNNINGEFTNYDYFLKDFKDEAEAFVNENIEFLEDGLKNFSAKKYSSLL
jgi:hypothetical protein